MRGFATFSSRRCKEGLVDRPVDWPGVGCVRALSAGQQLHGTWYDRTAESNARCQGRQVIPEQFAKQYRVHLSALPAWTRFSPAQCRRACAELIAFDRNRDPRQTRRVRREMRWSRRDPHTASARAAPRLEYQPRSLGPCFLPRESGAPSAAPTKPLSRHSERPPRTCARGITADFPVGFLSARRAIRRSVTDIRLPNGQRLPTPPTKACQQQEPAAVPCIHGKPRPRGASDRQDSLPGGLRLGHHTRDSGRLRPASRTLENDCSRRSARHSRQSLACTPVPRHPCPSPAPLFPQPQEVAGAPARAPLPAAPLPRVPSPKEVADTPRPPAQHPRPRTLARARLATPGAALRSGWHPRGGAPALEWLAPPWAPPGRTRGGGPKKWLAPPGRAPPRGGAPPGRRTPGAAHPRPQHPPGRRTPAAHSAAAPGLYWPAAAAGSAGGREASGAG